MLTMLLVLILTSANSIFLHAQNLPVLEHLTINDGLSQGYVSCLLQDDAGFIWIGTKNGLNRYDGRQVRVFSHNPFDPTTISNDWVISLCDQGRFLFVGTFGGGLNIFDKKTGKTLRLNAKADKQGLLTSGNIHQIQCDKYGNIWLRANLKTLDWRLVKIHFRNGWPQEQQTFDLENLDFEEIKIKGHFGIRLNQNRDQLWVLNKKQLFKIEAQTGQIQPFDLPKGFPPSVSCGIAITSDNLVWTTFGNYVLNFDGRRWSSTFFSGDETPLEVFEKKGKLILRFGTGLYEFTQADFARPFLGKHEAKHTIPMERGRVLDLLLDRSGIYWIGTSGYGVIKYNPHKQRFKNFFPGVSVNFPLLPDIADVFSFYKKVSQSELVQTGFRVITLPDSFIVLDDILCDRYGEKYMLYKRTNNKHLYLGKIGADRTVQDLLAVPVQTQLRSAFAVDKPGFFWIASNGQLIKAQPAKKEYLTIRLDTLVRTPYNVYDLVFTRNNHLWIATDIGLIEAIPKDNSFDFHLHTVNAKDKNTLQNNEVLGLLPDPNKPDILWIGTRGGGLNRLNIRSMKFSHLTTENGLPNNVIYGILADTAGALWMSSNLGIIKYDPASGAIRNYTVKDGLPTNEFNRRAYAQRADGTMLFGCVEGLVVFHPADFFINPVTPPVKITGLKINNRKIEFGDSTGILKTAIEYTQHITLPFSQNNFSLEFAALEYAAPSKNKFRYYLEGVEQPWVHESLQNKAVYLNLPPGAFIFKIKAANNDGVWNSEPTSLRITILPPWYRTTLAYSVYFLLLIALLYATLRFFINRQNLKHRLEMERKEAEWSKDTFIAKVHSVMEANMEDENFGVQELCRTLGISRTQLHQKIKTRTGKSTSLYIRSLRLRKARHLLRTTDQNVSEISIKVGFRHLQHFSKFYFEEFGEQPSKTR